MTTPTEARKLAEYRGHEHPATHIRDALRDLADQVEALTVELNNVGLPKLAMCPACTEEVPMLQCDQLTQDAKRYRWLRAGDYSIALSRSILNDTPHGIDKTIDAAIAKGTACKGFEIEPGVFSGCNQSAGDCPACGK